MTNKLNLPDSAKRVFSIAWPAIGEAYLQNLLGAVDAFFIARIGLLAIDAVGVTNIYSMTYIGVFTAISASLSVFLARAKGAKDVSRGRAAVWHGLVIAFFMGLLFGGGSLIWTSPLLQLMGAHGTLARLAFPYFQMVLGASPLIALFTAQSSAFRAIGDTKTPLRVGLEMNAFHVVLDYFLIFGVGPFHGFGIWGAGAAMVLVRSYGLLRLMFISRYREALKLTKEDMRIQGSLLWNMIRFAVPAALERLAMRLGQVIYFGLIVRMGVEVYATHNIAGTLTVFASTIGSGFATAATASIGQAIGEGEPAHALEFRRWCYIESAIVMTLSTALLTILSPWLGLLFTHDVRVIHLLIIILAIDTVSQPFLAAVLIDTSAIQAGGNSKYPMVVTAVGIWGVRTLGVYVFAWRLGWGLPAVWASIALDNALRSVLFAVHRKRRNWLRAM